MKSNSLPFNPPSPPEADRWQRFLERVRAALAEELPGHELHRLQVGDVEGTYAWLKKFKPKATKQDG